MKKIVVAGIGHVGVSLGVMLAGQHTVTMADIVSEKIRKINSWETPVRDERIEALFARVREGHARLHLYAAEKAETAYKDADYIIIAVPTDYDPETNCFDCSSIEAVIEQALYAGTRAVVVIKSTIPVGYTRMLREKYQTEKILFSPEFLRETKALYDNLYPSRIIVSCDEKTRGEAKAFASLLRECSEKKHVDILLMGHEEAEAVKLFSNAYLALRVSFFNELDTYAEQKGMNTADIIRGVCLDSRIGDYYNNPSFGYGGYCLPKDTKQLLQVFRNVPASLIKAVIESNRIRKEYIADRVLEKAGSCLPDPHNVRTVPSEDRQSMIGVFGLAMKADSDNCRQSAVHGVIERLRAKGADVILYEPKLVDGTRYDGCLVVNDLARFKALSDLIIANRYDSALEDVKDKVYTRDLFGRD